MYVINYQPFTSAKPMISNYKIIAANVANSLTPSWHYSCLVIPAQPVVQGPQPPQVGPLFEALGIAPTVILSRVH